MIKELKQIFLGVWLLGLMVNAIAGDQEDIKTLLLKFHEPDTKTFFLCRSAKKGASQNLDRHVMEQAYGKFFTKDLARLYAETNCNPDKSGLEFDPRYGDSTLWDELHDPRVITNLKIQKVSIKGAQAKVQIVFDYDRPGSPIRELTYSEYGNYCLYNLIKEGGLWKIDDVKIGGSPSRENYDFFVYESLRKELRMIQKKWKKIGGHL